MDFVPGYTVRTLGYTASVGVPACLTAKGTALHTWRRRRRSEREKERDPWENDNRRRRRRSFVFIISRTTKDRVPRPRFIPDTRTRTPDPGRRDDGASVNVYAGVLFNPFLGLFRRLTTARDTRP